MYLQTNKDRNTHISGYSYIHEQQYIFKYKVFKDFYSVYLRTGIFDMRWEYTSLSYSTLKTQTAMSPNTLHFSLGICYTVPLTQMLFSSQVRRELALHLFRPAEESSHAPTDARKKEGSAQELKCPDCVTYLGDSFRFLQVDKSNHEGKTYFASSVFQCPRDVELICPYGCTGRPGPWV